MWLLLLFASTIFSLSWSENGFILHCPQVLLEVQRTWRSSPRHNQGMRPGAYCRTADRPRATATDRESKPRGASRWPRQSGRPPRRRRRAPTAPEGSPVRRRAASRHREPKPKATAPTLRPQHRHVGRRGVAESIQGMSRSRVPTEVAGFTGNGPGRVGR